MFYPEKINTDSELAYDLRQVYSNEVLGQVVKAMQEQMYNRNYYGWFNGLMAIHRSIRMKYPEKENIDEAIDELVEEIIKLANKYSNTWMGKNAVLTESAAFEKSLDKLDKIVRQRLFKDGWIGAKKEELRGL